MYKAGDVILTKIKFVDSEETKKRPALILFTEHNNIIVAGITSNKSMKGIKLTKKEGAIKDSVIKTNYIFTISNKKIEKKLFSLTKEKRLKVYNDILKKLEQIKK